MQHNKEQQLKSAPELYLVAAGIAGLYFLIRHVATTTETDKPDLVSEIDYKG